MQTILVVEDEASIREVEVAYLKQAGYKIIEAIDGQDALDKLINNKIDLVILDLNLPKIDGVEVCKKVRLESDIPIIMVTARVDEIDELIGLETGADDYIKKPFSPSILVARAKSILRRFDDQEAINVSGILIDPEKMLVQKGKKKIKFTTTQFNILYALASNAEKVYTRNEILDRAYDSSIPPDVLDRTVDAHIKSIRKKLDKRNNQKYIETVIGKGYKFVS